jgi:hypothetical protein
MEIQRTTLRRARVTLNAAACMIVAFAAHGLASAQTGGHMAQPGCQPVSERKAEVGCYTMATNVLGELSHVPLYWHLDAYATRLEAEAAKEARGTIVESLGRVWLFTIGESD